MLIRSYKILIAITVLFSFGDKLALSQAQLVDPKAARECGCTLRKWPLLDSFLGKENPALAVFQPESFLPHFVDAGCGKWPRLPNGGVYGEVRFSSLASLDLFINHDWHDFNMFVRLDGAAYALNSAANARNNNRFLCYSNDTPGCKAVRDEVLMEVEWDTKHYPEQYWATAGDAVWLNGRYVWDCGHPPNYHTEIHPPKAIALTRLEPHIFTGDTSPSLTNKTYVYFHGRSGMKNYDFKTVAGVESVVFNGYRDSPVATEDYEFVVPLPPKPTGYTGVPVARVVDLPFGGPTPSLTVDPSQKFVRVKYPLNLGDSSPDRKFAAIIASGWRPPLPGITFRRLTVHIDQLQILKPHNAVSVSDWRLWLNVNGQWTNLMPRQAAQPALPLGLDRVFNVDGLLGRKLPPLKINKEFEVIVPDSEDATLTIQIAGWVNFYDELFGAREDVLGTALRLPSMLPQTLSAASSFEGRIGLFFKQYNRRSNFGIGTHTGDGDEIGELSTAHELVSGTLKNADETRGDYALSYRITEQSSLRAAR